MSNVQTPKWIYWMLAGVMLLALALRLWGIEWGLPYLYHHDETLFVPVFQHIFKTGDLNPREFDYGSVFFYINALAYVPYYLVGWAAGIFHSPNDIAYPTQLAMGVGITTMPSTYLLGRGVTMLFGLGSVAMVFVLGRRVTGSAIAGLLAAFMAAVSAPCVSLSRQITPDTFLVFFLLLTVWGAVRIYQEDSRSAYVLTGIAAGLVIGTKYNGGVVLGVVVLACLLRGGWAALKDRRLYGMLALTAATFLITTPFSVLDYSEFITYVRNQATHYSTGHAGMEGDTVQWYISFLWTQEGFVTVLGWMGTIMAVIKRSKPLIIVASFAAGYGFFISLFIVRNDRTILPLLPFLFILAAALIVEAAQWVTSRGADRRAVALAGVLVVALLAVVPLNMASAAAMRDTAPDSRLTGVDWIKANIPPGSKVGIEVGSPYLDPRVYSVQPVGIIIGHTPDWYIQQRYDYLIFAAGMFQRYFDDPSRYATEVQEYDSFFSKFPLVKEMDDGGYVVRVYKVPKK